MPGALRVFAKPALTFEDQLALLESRRLVIGDRANALAALKRVSYYRLSAYWYIFRGADDTFKPGSTFEDALWLYEFDRRLRLTVMDAIERAEVCARTRITFELAHAHGPFGHSRPAAFDPEFDHAAWYAGVEAEIIRAKEKFIEHFKNTYVGFPLIPVWMASEVMSLGTLSFMFKNLKTTHQLPLATVWGVHQRVAASWLHTLAYTRNVCAHHGRLWNRELAVKPRIPNAKPAWAGMLNRRVYSVMCILRELTRNDYGGDQWAERARGLLAEMCAKNDWRNLMGIPANWAASPFWA